MTESTNERINEVITKYNIKIDYWFYEGPTNKHQMNNQIFFS